MRPVTAHPVSRWLAATVLIGAAAATPATTNAQPDHFSSPEVTLTKVGDPAPRFTVTTLAGEMVSVPAAPGDAGGKTGGAPGGRIQVVVFWATWCSACARELPMLEREVWSGFSSSPGFAMVAIARGQTEAEVRADERSRSFTMPLAVDPDRSIYAKFATEGIPRAYVIGADGQILFQSVGSSPADLARMKEIIRAGLADTKVAPPA